MVKRSVAHGTSFLKRSASHLVTFCFVQPFLEGWKCAIFYDPQRAPLLHTKTLRSYVLLVGLFLGAQLFCTFFFVSEEAWSQRKNRLHSSGDELPSGDGAELIGSILPSLPWSCQEVPFFNLQNTFFFKQKKCLRKNQVLL